MRLFFCPQRVAPVGALTTEPLLASGGVKNVKISTVFFCSKNRQISPDLKLTIGIMYTNVVRIPVTA